MQKRTEGEQGRTTIHAFLLDRGRRLLPAAPAPGRHIEFIGNSLTCGYGTEGLSKDEPFKPQTENCNKAYACIIARYFGADYTLIAHSGRGAARNYGDKNATSQNTMADRVANTFDLCQSGVVPNLHFAAVLPGYCNDGSELGSSAHPNYAGHRKMAMLLIPYVSTLTGWEAEIKPVE